MYVVNLVSIFYNVILSNYRIYNVLFIRSHFYYFKNGTVSIYIYCAFVDKVSL